MRANEGSLRLRGSRTLTAAVAASMLLLSVFGGSVLAGNTSKQVYFGSGSGLGVFPAGTSFGYDLDHPANGNYSLSYTAASGGKVTSVFVTIENKGGGTLNHVVLEGGDNAPSPTANTNFIPDGTNGSPPICTGTTPSSCLPSLPTGFTYVQAYAPAGRPCTISATGRDIACDVGQIPNNTAVTYRLAIQVPAFNTASGASNAYQTWFTASGNEGTSNEGSNQDAFFALGTVNVDPNTLCADANFFTSGSFEGFGAPNCDQPATLTGGAFLTGAFSKVDVKGDTRCLAGFKCFGKGVFANVEFGAPVSGGLKWTVMWQKSSLNGTPKGVIHFLDAYLAGTDLKAYEIIDFKTTAQCPATILTTTKLPCLNGKPGFVTIAGISYYQAIFTTTGNGMGKGY
jgi:hypothetical protein